MVGWNEDEYTFFAWERRDSTSFNLSFDGLRTRLEPRFGPATTRIVDTYRESRPNATPTDIYVEVQSVTMMGLGSIEIAEKKAMQGGAPVYLYNFGYKSESKIPGTDYAMGTPHAMDIVFKFNNVANPSFFSGARPERLVASRNMAEMWTTFARTGHPAAVGQPAWPAYDLIRRATMRIDARCEVIEDRHRAERELWKGLGYIR
jgi:para-nitrobenzyl esterase